MSHAESPSQTAPWQFYQDLIASDARPGPIDIRTPGQQELGLGAIDRKLYTSADVHRQEVQRVWQRVWQFACREEEIAEVGDIHVYSLADLSILVVRSGEDEIKAYYNSCTHRGTALCSDHTHLQKLRCPFHGFTWKLDGSLDSVPCQWDFPQVSERSHSLQSVQVGRWGGFVFINPDPKAPPFEQYLENLPSHLDPCGFENMYIAGYYRKVLPSNWKASIEAFLEAFHVTETHPQTVEFSDDVHTQYDVFPGNRHVSRFLQPVGVPSGALPTPPTQQAILDRMFEVTMRAQAAAPTLPEGMSARAFMIAGLRAQIAEGSEALSDAELIDAMQYSLFPNLVLFRSIGFPVVYRFRPNGNDPDSSLFDMLILKQVPEGQTRPYPAEPVEMGDMRYAQVPELAEWLRDIYDQDVANLGLQQQGLKAGHSPITFSRYQESRLRHFHQTLRSYLEQP
jgi:phenylpropionate dioxygenase-like ring-hydroxylating dioxygenase large terminal subunit